MSAQVAREVALHVPLAQMATVAGCAVSVDAVSDQEIAAVRRSAPINQTLHDADLATLALVHRLAPDLVLTDDLAARRAVEAQGQIPMGNVGILLRAYKADFLDAITLDQAIEALFDGSTLYLNPSFKSYVRRLIASMADETAAA